MDKKEYDYDNPKWWWPILADLIIFSKRIPWPVAVLILIASGIILLP